MNPKTSLNAERRARELASDEPVDVLVIGLGATGAGVALDAASRGLKVTAIDAHDLAFGTSRWSSKLIHGGLRYLATGQVDVAYESAVERGILMTRTAPHLIRAMPFVMPLSPLMSGAQAVLAATGLRAGDLLRISARTPRRVLPGPRRLGTAETLRLAPGLRAGGLRGSLLSWDGQLCDDARLVTAIARTAAGHGAKIITRCRAIEVTGEGVKVRDELTGQVKEIRARKVVNAAGVWAGSLVPGIRLRPSRGTHLVLDGHALGELKAGMHIPVPGAVSRFALVLPQGDGRLYVGLTDEPIDGEIPDVPTAPEADIGFLLDILGTVLDTTVRRSDVLGAFAGLRPLLDADGTTADISRKHAVITSPDGVVTIVGGKLTTYRRMAQDAVDALGLDAGPSRTARIPLVGAGSVRELLRFDGPGRLRRRYGAEAPDLMALAADDPSLLEPVLPGKPFLRAELAWAVRHEGALDAGDLLDRRTRIGLVASDRESALAEARALFD